MATRSLLILLLLAVLAPGCALDDLASLNPLHNAGKVTVAQERQLGWTFDHEIRKKVVMIDDPIVLGVVNEIGQSIVRQIQPQPFIYHFRVIENPTLNAFAVPGGYIYLHSGTVLAVGSVDELAGVLAHEIGHVKGRHYARLQAKAAIPDLLAGVAGIVAAAATGNAAAAVTTQAVNEAIKLRYTREFEAEADRLGATFMARAGYDPEGMVHFFQRIVLTEKERPNSIPPYLYSHPDVKDRIAAVEALARHLRPMRSPPPGLGAALRNAQARLAWLVDTGRSRLETAPIFDRNRTDPLLKKADELDQAGHPETALAVLAAAEAVEPNDPRVPFHRAQILEALGRPQEAIAAYRRTVRIDPTRALVFYRLGLAYKAEGDKADAVFYLEQAEDRFAEHGDLYRRTEWELTKLTFPVILEAGIADGAESDTAATVAGAARTRFGPSDPEVAWWGRVGPHYHNRLGQFRVRWIDPNGREVALDTPKVHHRTFLVSTYSLASNKAVAGRWTVEARLGSDVVDRRSFRVIP